MIVTANSGVGKSRFTRFLFIKVPLIMQKKNPNFKVNIILNSLEESREKVEATFIQSRLYRKYGIKINYYDLNHFSETALSEDYMQKIEESKSFYDENIRPYLDIVIEPNPQEYYKYVLRKLKTMGKFYDRAGNQVDPMERVFERFEYDNPGQMLISISDTINNYDSFAGMNWWESIKKFSAKYCRQNLCMKCNVITVNLQQQASDKEKIEMNKLGMPIEQKLEPSLDGLGDIKVTQRDATVALGLFHPARYKISAHGNFDIRRMQGKYRSLHILKTREGEFDNRVVLPMEIQHGDFFKELPQDSDGKEIVYARLFHENSVS